MHIKYLELTNHKTAQTDLKMSYYCNYIT